MVPDGFPESLLGRIDTLARRDRLIAGHDLYPTAVVAVGGPRPAWDTAGRAGLRAEGRPVRGLCWYSRGDQCDWQTGLANPTSAVTEVGLFDARRQPRPVAERFADLVRSGVTGGDGALA